MYVKFSKHKGRGTQWRHNFEKGLGIARFLGQISVWISLGAASICGAAAVLMSSSFRWELFVIAFGCAYAVYNFDRVADRTGADEKTMPARSQTIRQHMSWIRASVIVALLVACGVALHLGIDVLLIAAAFPVASIAYVLPILPIRTMPRLKDVPLLKAFYVPACWCLLVVLAARVTDTALTAPAALACMAFVYLRIFVGATLGDIRDHDADRDVGVRTLATELGVPRTFELLHVLHAVTLPLLVVAVATDALPNSAFRLVPVCAFGYAVFCYYQRKMLNDAVASDVYDFEYISYFLVL